MIGRNYPPAKSFLRQSRYLLQDQTRAQTLYQEGVRGHDYRLMARDFEMIHQLHPGRTHPVFHSVLDFHPNEKLDDARMVEIAQKYLAAIRMVDTQYAIVKHLDTSHTHMHIIANRIDYNGSYIQTYPEILNSNDAVRKLLLEYNLIPAGSKNLRQTNFDALDNSETRKYAIYRSIKECLPGCRGLEELGQRLLLLGIDTQYRMDRGQRIGVSFRYQNEAFKGGNIDRECSLKALQQTLALKQDLTQWEGGKLALRAVQMQQEQLSQAKEVMEQQQRQKQELESQQRQKQQQEELTLRQKQEQELQQQQKQQEELQQRETRRRTLKQVPRLRIY